MDRITFKLPKQVADPIHPQYKKWIIASEEAHKILGNDGVYYTRYDSPELVFLTKELEPVFYDMLADNEKHRMYFDSDGEALIAMADYNILFSVVDTTQSPKTVVKSEELFDD